MIDTEQKVVIITQVREQYEWLQNALEGTAGVRQCEQTDLNDILKLIELAAASIVFVPVSRNNWVNDIRGIEGLMAARPHLACVAVADALEQDCLLAAMRAGAKDFITFGARASELSGLVRRLAERVPATISEPMAQGTLVTLASERPVMQSAFHALHLAASLKKLNPDGKVLVMDLGLPFAEAQQLFGLEGQFSFMDSLRNLRRLDQSLVDSAFPRHKSGVSVLSLTPDGLDFSEVTTSEMFLLIGTLRSLFTHIVVNICGLPTADMTELLIGNANHVVFVVEQSITSCRAALDFVARLKEIGVPITAPVVLVEQYLPKVSPDSGAIARSFAINDCVELPASPEVRLRAMNVGQLLFELAPQDVLCKRYRELADLVGKSAVPGLKPRQPVTAVVKPSTDLAGMLTRLKTRMTGL